MKAPFSLSLAQVSLIQEKNINGKRFGLFLFLLDVYSINMIGYINIPQG